jgi:hypothetical protein
MVVELMKIIFVLLVGNNLYLKILSQVQTITRKEIFYIKKEKMIKQKERMTLISKIRQMDKIRFLRTAKTFYL